MLEAGLHWAGDPQSRHGEARVPNLSRAHAYFQRIREFNVDAHRFAWHPSLRAYLEAISKKAKDEEAAFQQRFATRSTSKKGGC
jgi:hypothetical protein